MKVQGTNSKPQRIDVLMVFIAIVGTAVSFGNIYEFAQKSKPGDAIWSGVVLFASGILLATQLSKMRQRK